MSQEGISLLTEGCRGDEVQRTRAKSRISAPVQVGRELEPLLRDKVVPSQALASTKQRVGKIFSALSHAPVCP